MAKKLVKGQKIALRDLSVGPGFDVEISCAMPLSIPDFGCFGVDAHGRLLDERFFVRNDRPSAPEDAIVLTNYRLDRTCRFAVDLNKLPAGIMRLVFTAVSESYDFSSMSMCRIRVMTTHGEAAVCEFSAADFAREKAIIVGEIYLKDQWRLAAVGQGFNGGLPALLRHFGAEEINVTPVVPHSSAPITQPKIEIVNVHLENPGEAHNVYLNKETPQIIRVNLQWDHPDKTRKKSFLESVVRYFVGNEGADLDLGCMWSDKFGNKGVIQPLDFNFGSQNRSPYILLDRDDRTGAFRGGENMRIYRPDTIARVLIFAMIYGGTANFTDVRARLTLFNDKGGEIYIPLNAPNPRRTFCAVASIAAMGDDIEVRKEERYFADHIACDDYYGFGFNWIRKRKPD